MIKNFKDKLTKAVFNGESVRRLDKHLSEKARMRLELLNAASQLEDLYFPPSNNLHALQGFEPTRYAIWVNKR